MAPYQEIFVLWRFATLPSLMLLSKNEQFCPLTAGLKAQEFTQIYFYSVVNIKSATS